LVKLFVECGALPTETCEDTKGAPIHFAVVSERLDIVKYLVETCGVRVDTRCLDDARRKYRGLFEYLQQQTGVQNRVRSALTRETLVEHNTRINDVSKEVGGLDFDDGSSDEGLGENVDQEDVDALSEEDGVGGEGGVSDAGQGFDKE